MPCITKHPPRWKYSCSHLTIPFITPISLLPTHFSLSFANATPVIWNIFFNPPTAPTSSSLPTRSNTTPQPSTVILQTYISPLPGKKAPPTPTTNITTTLFNNIFRAPARSGSAYGGCFVTTERTRTRRVSPAGHRAVRLNSARASRFLYGLLRCLLMNFGACSQAQWLSKG